MASLPATRPTIGTDEDDVLNGTRHSDVMSGRFGDDIITGKDGNDEIWGGTGDDMLSGDNGNDIIYGSGGPDLVEVTGVEIVDDYDVSVVFEGETAGYRNTFGNYKIQDDGLITDVEILWPNASLKGSGGNLIQGESREYLDVSAGDTLGFFIISNGYNLNNGYAGLDLDVRQDGEDAPKLMFLDDDGNQATINSDAPRLYHFSADGKQTLIRTDPYHTAAFGETVELNPDGILHTTGVLKTDAGTLTLGFEDLYNGGDRDFDDSVFTVDIGVANALVLNAHYQQQDEGEDTSTEGVGTSDPVEIERSDNDILNGGTGQDELHGRSGDDQLFGNNGHDDLHGGSGNDELHGQSGQDNLYGNSGDDLLKGGKQDDNLNGNNGDDVLEGEDGNDVLTGGTGHDLLNGGNDDDILIGGSGNDTMSGGYGNDDLKGGAGDDIMTGGHNDDSLIGGSGNDTMDGGYGKDILKGGAGNDILRGGNGDDELYGGHDDDLFFGDAGDDLMHGGRGNDTVDYSAFGNDLSVMLHNKKAHGLEIGTDTLKYIDNVISGDGNDFLKGTSGVNVIEAGGGDDVIRGLGGADDLTGGAGSDKFVYRTYDLGAADTITDFTIGEDVLDFTHLSANSEAGSLLDLLKTSEGASGLEISVDLSESGTFTDICTLTGVRDQTVTSLFDNGCFLI